MAFSTFATAKNMLHSRQFNALMKAGVPPQLRGQVWWMCTGAGERRRATKESYPALLHQLHSKCAEMDIEKDPPWNFRYRCATRCASPRSCRTLECCGECCRPIRCATRWSDTAIA
ncbi:hypothetical protein PF005_g10324 [Phytophthora fragariae]|uniref:Rab-GAP TBC domain-containing protein n=1 Tax=Phytophthora fragariae TaxID=53985 RepID=A0A6A4C1P5_9STRA|nr:hypothetical protein PF003_g30763 [Phytophthora fragariae]KAE8937974.1 hypothetical protein PF009_g12141 [Phytophthora fragariae]KAE9010118.1 hypothetical protein PF011_g9961 [Phytophthora fragariae]KAE9080031.1 hypothetical protein PF010_g22541 [Phytophthora fragariae]KAE9098558.1 hypothetical protein PF006_g23335 [Phytophthora fragariae]